MSEADLKLAFEMLRKKSRGLQSYYDYYDGDQPLMYTAKRLEEIFKHLNAYFAENWCSVVIDAALERINLRNIEITDAGAAQAWKEIWARSEIFLESDQVHEDALVAGEAYFIGWPDENGKPEGYTNDPRMCHIFYDAEYPRVKKFAAKWWIDDENKRRITLYYPDHLEYYVSVKKISGKDGEALNTFKPTSFETAEEDKINEYKEVPVFHFRVKKRKVTSDLKNVIPVQNGINKLLNDMMVSAEFGAFKQRYVISNIEVNGKLKNAPNEVWDLPAGDGMGQQTQVGQFDETPLGNYLKAIEDLALAVSTITRTPKHYFFQIGSNLSGEALIAMEAGLNKKAQDRIDRFSPVWANVTRFLLKLDGYEVPVEKIQPIFDKPETVQPRTQAETRQMNVNAGVPLVTVLRDEGKSEAYIKQMLKDKQDDEARRQNSLAQALLEQQRRFSQGGGDSTSDNPGGER